MALDHSYKIALLRVRLGHVALFIKHADDRPVRSALTYFAWGMVISVGVLLLNLVVSGVTAIFQPRLRKVSIWIAAVSVVMLVGLGFCGEWPNKSRGCVISRR